MVTIDSTTDSTTDSTPRLFDRTLTALDELTAAQPATLAPIAAWVDATSEFIDAISALDPRAVGADAAPVMTALMQQCAQLIITAQQDVLKQVVASALALDAQRRSSHALVKAPQMPGRPTKLARVR